MNKNEIAQSGPGWAALDYDGNVKPGRYLLSGCEVAKVEA